MDSSNFLYAILSFIDLDNLFILYQTKGTKKQGFNSVAYIPILFDKKLKHTNLQDQLENKDNISYLTNMSVVNESDLNKFRNQKKDFDLVVEFHDYNDINTDLSIENENNIYTTTISNLNLLGMIVLKIQ